MTFSGNAAIAALVVVAVLGILCWQNPEILAWLFGNFVYHGPK